jgi:hypothetical protein
VPVSEPLGHLAAYFRNKLPLAATDMVRLASQARASGLRWVAIAQACDPYAAAAADSRNSDEGQEATAAAATRIFRDIQNAAGIIRGDAHRIAPIAWPCPDCQCQVTDVAPLGRPVHAEIGHTQGCPRLARDQAADDEDRRTRLPLLVTRSEPASGPLQRHRLAQPVTAWCPRCGWHGYFDDWAATISGNWARLICDDCWADLTPAVTVTVTYYICSTRPDHPGAARPFGVIRQRARSDRPPDTGQILTWEPFWQWTPILAEHASGSADCDVTQVSHDTAVQVIRSLILRSWPEAALGLPSIASAYPDDGPAQEPDPAPGQPGPGTPPA